MTNKFTARGISKETGKFVYGYYVKGSKGSKDEVLTNVEAHYIVEEGIQPYDVFPHLSFTEITQEPDRCLDFKDKNGKIGYENDNIEVYGENEGHFDLQQWNYRQQEYWCLAEQKDIEIIGNTHNIKEEDDK
jgi:hypothetical protein